MQLGHGDRVAVNVWNAHEHGILFTTPNYVIDRATAHQAIDSVWFQGRGDSTPLYVAIDSTYLWAIRYRDSTKNTVIIMLSDGGDAGVMHIEDYRNPYINFAGLVNPSAKGATSKNTAHIDSFEAVTMGSVTELRWFIDTIRYMEILMHNFGIILAI